MSSVIMKIVLVMVVVGCLVVPQVLGGTPITHSKGLQIKNKGADRLLVEMTGEDRFALPAGQVASLLLNDTWNGTIYAQPDWCKADICDGAPHTTAVIQFGGVKGTIDRYYVSLENGFNIPMRIQPTETNSFCKTSSCLVNIKEKCPEELQILDENETTVACRHDVDVFRNHCPHVVITKEDPEHSNAITCTTSNTYVVIMDE
ncbi:unnamed protein product [Callosobruchus maculatus]|uniref:Thaumatin-like protein n=1 Tax=Callosobruchus maculatus TaxID=64391 RepID=A0A653DJQ8_CALMS|nr:unnamed protein product [Callosobruchus maculatus]